LVQRCGPPEHDRVALPQQVLEFAPLPNRERALLLCSQQRFGACLLGSREAVGGAECIQALTHGTASPLARTDQNGTIFAITLQDQLFPCLLNPVKQFWEPILQFV
jgi:hypothetical protein